VHTDNRGRLRATRARRKTDQR